MVWVKEDGKWRFDPDKTEKRENRELRTLTAPWPIVRAVAFNPDGRLLAGGGDGPAVKLWAVDTGQEVCSLPVPEYCSALAFSPSGETLACGGTELALWDVKMEQKVRAITDSPSDVRAVRFSSDGKVLASVSGGREPAVYLWDADTGKLLHTLSGHSQTVLAIAFNPNGKTMVSGSEDKTVRLWDSDNGKRIKILPNHSAPVRAVAFSHDGDRFASASDDGTVIVWEALTGNSVRTWREQRSGEPHWLAFTPDGKTLIVGTARVQFRDVETGKERRSISKFYPDSLALSFDGKVLATGGEKIIKLWGVP
jgi:WD40 repeat protein